METTRFDALTKTMSRSANRRTVLGALVVSLTGGAVVAGGQTAGAHGKAGKNKRCKPQLAACTANKQCCGKKTICGTSHWAGSDTCCGSLNQTCSSDKTCCTDYLCEGGHCVPWQPEL